jgi:hypothetical protein
VRLRFIVAIWAAVAALFLSQCGGGASGDPPSPQRTDLLFGYYGDCPTCIAETHDHINLYWVSNWSGLAVTEQSLFNARVAGITHIVLAVPTAEADARFYLTSLEVDGYLQNIDALYPVDEPDQLKLSDSQVTATNAMLRRVMADYPSLSKTKLAVIYSASSQRPGIASYDWVGMDDYNKGCEALGTEYASLKGLLRPDQRTMLVSGGASPWQQDPACFLEKANSDPQVIALIAFIWFDSWGGTDNLGIRSNATRKLYCDAGRKVIGGAAC